MKVTYKNIGALFFVVAILLAYNPTFFERKLFFNELLSLFGMCTLYFYARVGRFGVQWRPFNVLLVYVGLRFLFSFFEYTSLEAYLRHSVILYSMFCAFAGYFCFVYFYSRMRSFGWIQYLALSFSIFIVPMQRIFMLGTIPFLLNAKLSYGGVAILAFVTLLVLLVHGGGSPIFAIGFFIYVIAFKRFRTFLFVSSVLLLILFFVIFINADDIVRAVSLRADLDGYGGFVSYVYSLDPNLLTRMALWVMAVEVFLNNPIFGIGFGTELFDVDLLLISFDDYEKNRMLGYYLGSHNSFLTILARLGIVGFGLLLYLVLQVFSRFYFYRKNGVVELTAFISFFYVVSIAMLNVVLESPIYSGYFWFVFGMAAANFGVRNNEG